MIRLTLCGVISLLYLLSHAHLLWATDSASLCSKPFKIEEQCVEDAPKTLALLIAGAKDPEKALYQTIEFWRSLGKPGGLFADEILRLVNARLPSRHKIANTDVAGNFNRVRFTSLCTLKANELCKEQAKNNAQAQKSLEIDVKIEDVPGQPPLSPPFCSQPIISSKQAELALLDQLTEGELSRDETTTCNLEQCTREWSDIVTKELSQDGGMAAVSRIVRRDDAMFACLRLTSPYPWQDENNPQSGGPDLAYNCKDAVMAFIACMKEYGFGDDVFRVHIKCSQCALSTTHGHAINLYRNNDGKFCPVDPQKPAHEEPNLSVYQGCCLPTAKEAADCAELRYCSRQRFEFMCCKPANYSRIFSPDECPKEKSYCQNPDGTYNCPADPNKCIPKKPDLDECEKRMKFCYEISDSSSDRCKLCNRCRICPSFWNCLGILDQNI